MEKMKKDCWDKSKIVAEIFAIIIIAFYGHWINSTLKEKELNVKMTEVAITILSNKPSNETKALRRWAVDIINHYSEIPLSQDVQKNLMETSIPSCLSESNQRLNIFNNMAKYGIRYLRVNGNGEVYLGKDLLMSNGILLDFEDVETIEEEKAKRIVNLLKTFKGPMAIICNGGISLPQAMKEIGWECDYTSLYTAEADFIDEVIEKMSEK